MARSEKMVSVNRERLKHAREYYGLSLDEVADRSKIKRDLLEKFEKFEKESDTPSYAQLTKLSELYDRPLLYFFFNGNPPSDDKLSFAFRKIEKHIDEPLSMQMRKMLELGELMSLDEFKIFNNSDLAERRLPEGLPFILCIAKTENRLYVYRKGIRFKYSDSIFKICEKYKIKYIEVEKYLLETIKK
ncbi:MAG: helix-turn-helix domain-containing protein [Defluviitaleaceae bacterium]|nr:helix-turn-helix domain-containing protein [Defluviitaleaceae bacterium]